MSSRHQNNRSFMRRLRSWLVSPDGFAAAAAGRGEPAPLLALSLGKSGAVDATTKTDR